MVEEPFDFARSSHLIPAVVEEYAVAARHFPIVFAPTERGLASVFLCGLKPGQNLFVDPDGRWNAPYLPAYLRRYPFILGERGEDDPVLCVDEGYAGFGPHSVGEALFSDAGEPTPYLSEVIRLVGDYAAAARRTEETASLLAELKLMRNITIDVSTPTGQQSASIHGLSVVDEDKLNALDDSSISRLRGSGVLGAVYAHLFSIGSTNLLAQRLEKIAQSGSGG